MTRDTEQPRPPHYPQHARAAYLAAFMRSLRQDAPQQPLPRVMRYGEVRPTDMLQDRWVAHLERHSAAYMQIGTVRTAHAARDVCIHDVACGRIVATHGKFRLEVEVPPPDPGPAVEATRTALAEEASEGPAALRDALRLHMRANAALLMPDPARIRGRCPCRRAGPVCPHAILALAAFGARLDAEPGLLVRLRGLELLEIGPGPLAADSEPLTGDLAEIFGIDLEGVAPEVAANTPVPPAARKQVEREYLRVLGLPARTIDAWLREGVLLRTEQQDVYVRTDEANRRICERLAR